MIATCPECHSPGEDGSICKHPEPMGEHLRSRFVIPAGSSPGEKERGQWVKLTAEELEALEATLTRAFRYERIRHGGVLPKNPRRIESALAKFRDARSWL